MSLNCKQGKKEEIFHNFMHYWMQGLCRGPEALGKGSSAVGEGFAEGSPR